MSNLRGRHVCGRQIPEAFVSPGVHFVLTRPSCCHRAIPSTKSIKSTSFSPRVRLARGALSFHQPVVSFPHHRTSSVTMRGSSDPPAPPTDRVLACLPYLIPLLDALSFGKYVFSKVPVLAQFVLAPLLPIYNVYRGVPLLAFGVFLVLYLLVVRNSSISRYIRFNTYQALIIDIALIIPQLFQGTRLPVPAAVAELGSTTVFYAAAVAVVYAVARNAQGLFPDEIPGISNSVYQQMGPF